ncbi:MAG: dienelactone hydrolase family protein [Labilithrix sp.]|nr:dienelactone hydrolase family protein [Labilithrix sp.]
MASAFSFDVGTHGKVTGALFRAADPIAQATLVLAHGAGAPRTHPFMTSMAGRIAKKGVDVVTFNFLYAEAGRRMPDRVELLEATWRAAIATVRARGGLSKERLFIGGKSMGGRIATHIAAANEGLVLAGVVLLGYPLHPIGKPRVVRDEILAVRVPMLVVQGTRDELGAAAELKKLLAGSPRARVHAVEGGDHSLSLLKREGAERQERALDAAAAAIAAFVAAPRAKPRARKKASVKQAARAGGQRGATMNERKR